MKFAEINSRPVGFGLADDVLKIANLGAQTEVAGRDGKYADSCIDAKMLIRNGNRRTGDLVIHQTKPVGEERTDLAMAAANAPAKPSAVVIGAGRHHDIRHDC